MLSILKYFFKNQPPMPLGRWISVKLNQDVLDIKYRLKKERQILLKNNIDPYKLNRDFKDPKEKLVSNLPFIDW